MSEFDAQSIKLLRHILGSVDLEDVREREEMSETERKDYVAVISGVWPRLEKDIKRFIYEQAISNATEVQTWEQTIFGKGTLNGFSLLLELWANANAEHKERMQPQDKPDESPIGKVESNQ